MQRSQWGDPAGLCEPDSRRRRKASLIAVFAGLLTLSLAGESMVAQPPQTQPSPAPSRQAELVGQGLSFLDGGKAEAARLPLEEARALARETGDVATEAEANRGLGLVASAAKDFVRARAQFEEALRLYESIHDLRGRGRTQNSLGILAWTQGNWKDVHRFYSAAADAFAAAGEPVLQARALRNLTFDGTMSDSERIAVLGRAWDLLGSLDAPRDAGLVLHQWGDLLANRGEYAAAIDKFEAASLLLDRGGRPLEVSALAVSLGAAHRRLGMPELALPYFQNALSLVERSGDQRAMAQILGAFALSYGELGRYAEALDFARRALVSARASGNRPAIFTAISQLSEEQLDSGLYSEALEVIETALKDADQQVFRQDEVFLRRALSRGYEGLKRLDDALREADRAVALGEADARPLSLMWTLEQRARVRLLRDDRDGALKDSQRALDLVERVRAKLPARDFVKQGFGDAYQHVFGLTIALDVSRLDAAAALMVAEQARARAFQDLLASREIVGRRAAAAIPGGAPASDASTEVPTFEEMKAVVARLHAPLLAYWVSPEETFVWVVTENGEVRVRRLQVEARRIDALARAAAIGPDQTTPPASWAAASSPGHADKSSPVRNRELRELYDLLIRPVREVLNAQASHRLIIIPHGPLFRVSFASLVDEQGRYLIEQYETHYAPAVGVLRFTARNRRSGPIRHALLVADPDPSSEGPAASGARGLPRLPGARREVVEVARAMGASAEVLVGPQATEARVRSLIGGRDLLHFATHAIVVDNDPLGSYLALTPSGHDPETDGRLTAAEIYGLDVTADLVVMSACRSGAGRVTGDGITGLSRGLFYAGAPSVLATLWDLADEPTQFLMRRFYAHWTGGGEKAAALRASQLDLIRALRAGTITVRTPFGPTKLTERPSLWAAFVLLGEP